MLVFFRFAMWLSAVLVLGRRSMSLTLRRRTLLSLRRRPRLPLSHRPHLRLLLRYLPEFRRRTRLRRSSFRRIARIRMRSIVSLRLRIARIRRVVVPASLPRR